MAGVITIPIDPIEKTGFISEFTIELNENRDDAGRVVFFRFTLTDDIAGMFNPLTFVMSRDSTQPSDDPAIPWQGLPFSSVQVAAVSALKDAYINRKRVIARSSHPRIGPARHRYELLSVTLSEGSGHYFGQPQACPAVNHMGQPIGPARHRGATTTSRRRTTRR